MPEHSPADQRDADCGAKIEWSREEMETRFSKNRLAELEANLASRKFDALFGLSEKFPGLEVYLTGGIIRDTLTGAAPKDYDFIIRFPTGTPAARQQFESFFGERTYASEKDRAKNNWKNIGPHGTLVLKGKDFGVYKFTPAGESEPLDLAFPRTEVSKSGGFGGTKDFEAQSDPTLPVEKEIGRRDFTINALALKLARTLGGKINLNLFDYVGGLDDLKNGMLRAVHDPDVRLNEDKSRVARALRFATKGHLAVDPALEAALRRQAEARVFEQRRPDGTYVVSRETLASEILKAFAADPVEYLNQLEKYGFLDSLFPDLTRYRAPKKIPDALTEKTASLSDSTSDRDLAIRQQIFGDAKKALEWHREKFGSGAHYNNEYLFLLLHEIGKCAALQKSNGNGKNVYPDYPELSQAMIRRAIKELKLDSLKAGDKFRIDSGQIDSWLARYQTALSLFSPERSKDLETDPPDGALIAQVKKVFPELTHDPFWRLIQAKINTGSDVDRSRDELPTVAGLLAKIEQQEASLPLDFKDVISGQEILDHFFLSPSPEVGQTLENAWTTYCSLRATGEYHSLPEIRRGVFAQLLRNGQIQELWSSTMLKKESLGLFTTALSDQPPARTPERAAKRSLLRALEKASCAYFLGESLEQAAEQEPLLKKFLEDRAATEKEPTPVFEVLFATSLAHRPTETLAWLEKSFTAKKPSTAKALFPELAALNQTEQDTYFHSEGNVWTHTKLLFDVARAHGWEISPTLALAMLYHDIAKPQTAERKDDRIHFFQHAEIGAARLKEKIDRLGWRDAEGLSLAETVQDVDDHDLKFTVWNQRPPRLLELRALMPAGRESSLYRLMVCDFEASRPADPTVPEQVKAEAIMRDLETKLALIEKENGRREVFDQLLQSPEIISLIGKNSQPERASILYEQYLSLLGPTPVDLAALETRALLASPRWLAEYVKTKLVPAQELMNRGISGPAIAQAHRQIIASVEQKLQSGATIDSLSREELLAAV